MSKRTVHDAAQTMDELLVRPEIQAQSQTELEKEFTTENAPYLRSLAHIAWGKHHATKIQGPFAMAGNEIELSVNKFVGFAHPREFAGVIPPHFSDALNEGRHFF